MITVKKLHALLTELIEDGHGDKPCIYARDDEGNGYGKLLYEPQLAAVYDMDSYSLEVTIGEDDPEDFPLNYNAVLIN